MHDARGHVDELGEGAVVGEAGLRLPVADVRVAAPAVGAVAAAAAEGGAATGVWKAAAPASALAS